MKGCLWDFYLKNEKAKNDRAFCAAAFSFSVHGNDLSKIQQQIKQQEQKNSRAKTRTEQVAIYVERSRNANQ